MRITCEKSVRLIRAFDNDSHAHLNIRSGIREALYPPRAVSQWGVVVPASTAFCSKIGRSGENDYMASTSLDSWSNVEDEAENCPGPDDGFGFQHILNIPMEEP